MFLYLETLIKGISLSHLNILLLLGIALFGGTIGGRIFQKLKIPQVVGYIIIGIILGQSGFQIVNKHIIEILEPFNFFALALIGFMIGGELKISVLKKYGKQFTYILLFEALFAFIIVSIFISIIGYFIFDDFKISIALGLLLGSISAATAPAATTDVLWENKTRGPLTSTILGIIAMDDGVALLLFAISASIAGALLGSVTESLSLSLLHLLYEIGFALITGILFGYTLSKLLKKYHEEDRVLAFSIGAILLLIGLSIILKVDMLLAAMTMGFVVINFTPRKSEATFKLVDRFTPPIYILFFVLVGAKLNIRNISFLVALLALIYFIGRTIGKSLGAFWGAKLSNSAQTVQKYLPYCLFSQAGVAIGLSILAGQKFSGEIGNTITMVITTTTFIVQLIGPSFVKYAVGQAGEIGLNITEEDLIEKSKAADIIDRERPELKEDMSIKEILSIFSENDYFYYPVKNRKNDLVGIVSIDNVKNTFLAYQLTDLLVAHDLMEPVIASCSPETSMKEVHDILKHNQLECLPVIKKDKKLYGLIETRSIQRLISKKLFELRKKADQLG